MWDFLKNLFERYQENKLVIGLTGIVLGTILTKFIPALWSLFWSIITWTGKKIGGRFAYRDFEKSYLDWVVTEHKELKLTGVVTSDEAKKPKLEQVFVSLQIAKQRESDSKLNNAIDDLNLEGTIITWDEIRELLLLQWSNTKDASQQRKIRLCNVVSVNSCLTGTALRKS